MWGQVPVYDIVVAWRGFRGGWTRSCDIRAYAILYRDFFIKALKVFSLVFKRIPKE